jgi:hypothetical protein
MSIGGFAQVTTATLTGTVADTTGALIPGAKVTVTNRGNKFTRSATANGSGVFNFPGLDSGDYELTVTCKGFGTYVVSGIHLDPSDTRNITTIRMAPGAFAETITVSAAGQNHIEDDGSRSALITADDLQKLSVEGREVTELLKILPGSAINTGIGNNTGVSNSTFDPGQVGFGGAAGSYSMSGSPVNGVAIRSDGANLTDPGTGAGSLQTINAEATSEVKIQTSNFGADNANGPLVISAVGKSGASDYHGSAYVYGRTSQLNSTDSIARVFNSTKPPDHYIYPGLSLGGPIKIPGTTLNHNKHLTFFVSGEDYIQREVYAYNNVSNAVTHALVPTAAMRKGDFSVTQIQKYLPPGLSQYACDPSKLIGAADCENLNNTVKHPAGNGTTDGYNGAASNWNNLYQVPISTSDGTAIKGNCNGVPGDCLAGHLDPGASAFFRLIPLPNTPGGTTTALGYNYTHTDLVNNDIYELHGRLDYEKGRSKFFLSFTPENGLTNVPQNFGYFASGSSGGVDTPGGSKQTNYTYSGSLNWNMAISSTLNNEAFVSGLYSNIIYSPQKPNQLFDDSIGYPYTGAYDNGTKEFPNLGTYGNEGIPLGFFPDFSFGLLYNRTFSPGFGDNLTKQIGKHSLKAGVNVERPRINSTTNISGAFATNGTTAIYYVGPQFQNPDPSKANGEPYIKYYSTCFDLTDPNCSKENGNSNNLANYLVGDLGNNGWSQSNIIPHIRLHAWTTSMYFTDDWKILRNLSLTGGIRIEHIGRWIDDHGNGAAVFSPALYAMESDNLNNPAIPLPGFRWHGIDPSIPISGFQTREFFYEPRAGFSWDVLKNAKTTLSGGYGMYRFRDGQQDSINSALAPNGYRQLSITPPSQDPATIGVTGAPPNQGGLRASYIQSLHISPKPGIATSSFTTSGNGYLTAGQYNYNYAVDQTDSEVPLTQNYSLTLTQQLPKALTFSIGYVGNYSQYLLDDNGGSQTIANINAIPVGAFFRPDPNTESSFYGLTYTSNTIGQGNFANDDFRPYPRYGPIQLEKHILTAHYDALQTTIERSKGALYLKANYTFSKNYGQRGGYSNGSAGDSFNLLNDYGPLAYDRTHIINISSNYNFGTNHGGFGVRALRPVVNGWQLSNITNIQSGPDLQATNYTSNFGLSGQNSFSNIPFGGQQYLGTTDVNLQPLLTCDPRQHLAPRQYINPNCFALPAPGGSNGPFRYPYLRGPEFFQSDLTVIKDFQLKEKRQLEFRVAAFNFLNYKLKTYTNLHPQALTLVYNNGIPQNGTFGYAADNAGRRVMEVNVRYSF